jgi:hypothetical protein
MKGWIPAYAESTPQKRPSPYTERLGRNTPRIENKYSGGNDRRGTGSAGMTGLQRKDGRLTTLGWNEQLTPYRT